MTSTCTLAIPLAVIISLSACGEERSDHVPQRDGSPEEERIEGLPPLVFSPALPTTVVATVNGMPVRAYDLLEFVLMQNFSAGVNSLVLSKITEYELVREGIALDEDAIEDEIKAQLRQSSPGRSIADLNRSGWISIEHLRRQARTNLAWREIFWKRQQAKDQRRRRSNPLPHSIPQTMQGYETRIRGSQPRPLPGLAAQVIHKVDGAEMYVTASELLDFLIGLAKPGALIDAREHMIDRTVIASALARAGATVTDHEIAQWAQEQRAKHPPPFTWEQICKIKGTSTEREMERMRRIRAYQRVANHEPKEVEVMAFIETNESFFRGKTKKVSHILVRTTDEETDLPIRSKEAEAEKRIRTIHEKLVEGLAFGWVAENYSDNTVTARGKGRLAQRIKQWGGPLDPAFREAAWRLEKIGDMSDPIKSRLGWHIIKLDEVNEPEHRDIDWKDSRYWEWAVDEYLTQEADAWLAQVRARAEIHREPDQVIFDLKRR